MVGTVYTVDVGLLVARKSFKVSKIVLQKKLIESTLLIDCLNITAMWIQLAFLQNDFEHF